MVDYRRVSKLVAAILGTLIVVVIFPTSAGAFFVLLAVAVALFRFLKPRGLAVPVAVGVLFVLGFIPFQQSIAPRWSVRFLDDTGQPLRGIQVTEIWQQYSLEEESREEDRSSDSHGRVLFERRTRRSSLFARMNGCLSKFSLYGVHTSCGPVAYLVVVPPKGLGASWRDEDAARAWWPRYYQRNTIVVYHCPNPEAWLDCWKENAKASENHQ